MGQEVAKDDKQIKAKELQEKGTGSYGYGGKFGVQKDRMDKVRVYISWLQMFVYCDSFACVLHPYVIYVYIWMVWTDV